MLLHCLKPGSTKQTIHDSDIHIPGYVMKRKDRNRNGGGVAVYIKDDIQYSRRNDIENDKTESLWIEIQQVHKKIFCHWYTIQTRNGSRVF